MQSPEQIAEYIIGLYRQFGDEDYIGEPVSQLEHMCQCAMLAEMEGYDDEVILAAFFHDIGHLCEHIMNVRHMDGYGVVDHEKLGAEFLRRLHFSDNVTRLIENHVQAKRYLTWSDSAYYEKLSEASKKTLQFQGGKMSAEEASEFQKDNLFDLHIKLRRWDEFAKLEFQSLEPLDKYSDIIIRHLQKNMICL
jgi:phosphonate degradation associated HDIG domain protein